MATAARLTRRANKLLAEGAPLTFLKGDARAEGKSKLRRSWRLRRAARAKQSGGV